jgi:hypothetical protein
MKENLSLARQMIKYINVSSNTEVTYIDMEHAPVGVRWLFIYQTLNSFISNYERIMLYFKTEAEKKGMVMRKEEVELESGDEDDEMVEEEKEEETKAKGKKEKHEEKCARF